MFQAASARVRVVGVGAAGEPARLAAPGARAAADDVPTGLAQGEDHERGGDQHEHDEAEQVHAASVRCPPPLGEWQN